VKLQITYSINNENHHVGEFFASQIILSSLGLMNALAYQIVRSFTQENENAEMTREIGLSESSMGASSCADSKISENSC
jgi:hypothetical protein